MTALVFGGIVMVLDFSGESRFGNSIVLSFSRSSATQNFPMPGRAIPAGFEKSPLRFAPVWMTLTSASMADFASSTEIFARLATASAIPCSVWVVLFMCMTRRRLRVFRQNRCSTLRFAADTKDGMSK